MPHQQAQTEEDARLLYVGMTRAIKRLVLLGSKPSAFMARMESAIAAGKLSLEAPDDVLV